MVKHISYPTVQIDSNSTVFASTTLYRDKPFVSTSNNVPDLYSLEAQIECYEPDQPEEPDAGAFFGYKDRFSEREYNDK